MIVNDPFRVIPKAFAKLYPGKEYFAHFVTEELFLENGDKVRGLTIFPYDGSMPEIKISSEITVNDATETFIQGLAHVAVGAANIGYDEKFEAAFKAIGDEYFRMVENE